MQPELPTAKTWNAIHLQIYQASQSPLGIYIFILKSFFQIWRYENILNSIITEHKIFPTLYETVSSNQVG